MTKKRPSEAFQNAIVKNVAELLATIDLDWGQVEPFGKAASGYVNDCLKLDSRKGLDLDLEGGVFSLSVFVVDNDSLDDVAAGPRINLIDVFTDHISGIYDDDLDHAQQALDLFYKQACLVIKNLKAREA